MVTLFSGCFLCDSGEKGLEDRKEERMGTGGLGLTGFVLTVSTTTMGGRTLDLTCCGDREEMEG
jgi:hypothetical protein